MDSTKVPKETSAPNQPMTSVRVLLGTIAATGALGLASVVAMAPTKETFLLVGALSLPWLAAALVIGLPILIPASTPKRLQPAAPRARGFRPAMGTWRLAGAVAALALLLLASVVVQRSGDTSSPAERVAPVQVASTDISGG